MRSFSEYIMETVGVDPALPAPEEAPAPDPNEEKVMAALRIAYKKDAAGVMGFLNGLAESDPEIKSALDGASGEPADVARPTPDAAPSEDIGSEFD